MENNCAMKSITDKIYPTGISYEIIFHVVSAIANKELQGLNCLFVLNTLEGDNH